MLVDQTTGEVLRPGPRATIRSPLNNISGEFDFLNNFPGSRSTVNIVAMSAPSDEHPKGRVYFDEHGEEKACNPGFVKALIVANDQQAIRDAVDNYAWQSFWAVIDPQHGAAS